MGKSKYPGLNKHNFTINTRGYIDQDYINKLSPEEKEWLSKFNDEYYGGKIKKGDETALNKKDEHRKDCYNRKTTIKEDSFMAIKTKQLKFFKE